MSLLACLGGTSREDFVRGSSSPPPVAVAGRLDVNFRSWTSAREIPWPLCLEQSVFEALVHLAWMGAQHHSIRSNPPLGHVSSRRCGKRWGNVPWRCLQQRALHVTACFATCLFMTVLSCHAVVSSALVLANMLGNVGTWAVLSEPRVRGAPGSSLSSKAFLAMARSVCQSLSIIGERAAAHANIIV